LAGSVAIGSPASGTNPENATHCPSGDQLIPPGERCRCVSFAVWPVSIQRRKSWALPFSSLDTNSSLDPSGDQRGDE
jgi:hypothetical protein